MSHAGLLAALDELLAGRPTAELVPGVERLRTAYRSQQVPQQQIIGSADEAASYAAYRMPATYAAVRSCLLQAEDRLEPIGSVVDVGAGTGAASWAVADVLSPARFTMLEQSPAASAVGAALARSSPVPALRDAQWQSWRASALRAEVPPADLAVAAYVFAELDDATQATVLDAMLDAAPTVLVVEPGTPAGYARVIEVRRRLLAAGRTIVAPCPHQAECPLVDRDDWCHFGSRVTRSARHRRLKEGSLSYEDEKFSFVLAGPGAARAPDRHSRIIRRPVQRKGMVDLMLCRSDGTAGPEVASKRAGERYKVARKAEWGDPWESAAEQPD